MPTTATHPLPARWPTSAEIRWACRPIILVMFTLWCGTAGMASAPGDRITDFGTLGEVLHVEPRFVVADIATAADGTLIVALRTQTTQESDVKVVGLDPSTGAIVGALQLPVGFASNARVRLAVDGQDRVLVAGSEISPSDNADFLLIRLTPTPTFYEVDAAFGPVATPGVVRAVFDRIPDGWDFVQDVEPLADGRIVLLGSVQQAGGDVDVGLAFFDANGLPDGTVTQTGLSPGLRTLDFGGEEGGVSLQQDASGRLVLLGGQSNGANGYGMDVAVARLLSNGSLDGSFATGGQTVFRFRPCVLCPDNPEFALWDLAVHGDDAYITGTATDWSDGTKDLYVARLSEAGGLDPFFGGWRRLIFEEPVTGYPPWRLDTGFADLEIEGASGIHVITSARAPVSGAQDHVALARLLFDGTLDPEFGDQGRRLERPILGSDPSGFRASLHKDRLAVAAVNFDTATLDEAVSVLLLDARGRIFEDGFESGGTSAWVP